MTDTEKGLCRRDPCGAADQMMVNGHYPGETVTVREYHIPTKQMVDVEIELVRHHQDMWNHDTWFAIYEAPQGKVQSLFEVPKETIDEERRPKSPAEQVEYINKNRGYRSDD